MSKPTLKFLPGDRVVFIEAWVRNYANYMGFDVWATEGTIGRVLSYDEFLVFYRQRMFNASINQELVSGWMQRGERFPIILETIVPIAPDDPDYHNPDFPVMHDLCKPGAVFFLEPDGKNLRIIA